LEAVRIALLADGWACALRGAVSLVLGLAVLLMPHMGQLLLVPLLTLHLLWGGTIGLAALQQAPAWRGLRDLRALEAAVSMAAGVVLGEVPWAAGLVHRHMLLPVIAAPGILGGVLMLLAAARLRPHAVRPWLACAGAASAASGLGLLVAAFVLARDPESLARFLGWKGEAFSPLAAVLITWFPLQTASSGAALLALAVQRLAAAGPGAAPVHAWFVHAWFGWPLLSAAALAGTVAGFAALHFAHVGLALLLAAVGPSAMLEVRRVLQRPGTPRSPGQAVALAVIAACVLLFALQIYHQFVPGALW